MRKARLLMLTVEMRQEDEYQDSNSHELSKGVTVITDLGTIKLNITKCK